MNKISSLLFLSLIFLTFTSCNDEDSWDCLKTTGETVNKELNFGQVFEVVMNDNIDLILSQGSQQEIVLRGGKNVLAEIHFNFTNGRLEVANTNTCNWVRSYRHPELYVTVPDLRNVILQGFGNVRSQGNLVFDTLNINSLNGVGDIDLTLESQSVGVSCGRQSIVTLKGETNRLGVLMSDESKLIADELVAQEIFAASFGVLAMRLNPVQFLAAQVSSRGNICYVNTPAVIRVFNAGKGGEVFECP